MHIPKSEYSSFKKNLNFMHNKKKYSHGFDSNDTHLKDSSVHMVVSLHKGKLLGQFSFFSMVNFSSLSVWLPRKSEKKKEKDNFCTQQLSHFLVSRPSFLFSRVFWGTKRIFIFICIFLTLSFTILSYFFNSTHLGLGCVWLHGDVGPGNWNGKTQFLFHCLVALCIWELGIELEVLHSHMENDKLSEMILQIASVMKMIQWF